MTTIKFVCSDEKAAALLKFERLYDSGVELEPVQHATLIEGEWDEVYCSWGTCSKCGADNLGHARYCNECGAKLDLEG